MDEAEQRARVVEVARSWLGTPFHHGAQIKGVGVDCARFLAAVYAEAGIVPAQEIAPYSPQWMLNGDAPLFEEHVKRYAHEIDRAPMMGDVVLYKVGRMFAHGAIIVDWPVAIIHAFINYKQVVETGAEEADLRGRARIFFSAW